MQDRTGDGPAERYQCKVVGLGHTVSGVGTGSGIARRRTGICDLKTSSGRRNGYLACGLNSDQSIKKSCDAHVLIAENLSR